MRQRRIKINENNLLSISSEELNYLTYLDYFNRIKQIATSIFEWINLPNIINPKKLENDLFLKRTSLLIKGY